ncbi:MAG: polysaccharide biosynthesis protein CapD [Acidobacteria bacterium OLB17]|nr:MAG: polysaccharide biosynthesis protein CapD [Acidobacteria bacterium OLB17]MCZ2390668.1 polysaccharide biosynthesis protein [Acidobacteriota bacterium]
MKKAELESSNFWFLRRPAQFLADVFVLCAAFFIAYLPAINMRLGEFYVDTALRQLPLVVLVQLSSLFLVGAYSLIWRYVSIEDIKVFIKAAAISLIFLLLLRFLLSFADFDLWQIPVSVILIDSMIGFGGLLALRILRRFFYELNEKNHLTAGRKRGKRKPTLVVGAGRMGATLVKEIQGRADSDFDVRGFVDDDARKVGGSVNRVKVIGGTDMLAKLVHELDIQQVVLAIDHANGKDIRRIMNICSSIPVKAQIIPSLDEIAHGRVNVTRLRDVEIEDLLGREPVELDDKNLNDLLSGRTVMVTGAGGSIGSELVRQISNYHPKKVLLVERSEYMLFEIDREIEKAFDDLEFVPLIADISDEPRMREIFEAYGPEVIFHAAAHKHVPLMEQNPIEAIKNNVIATRLVGSLAGEFGAKAFVMISTDKAVNPTSVMGASKRIAEIVIQDLNQAYATKFVAVRFGNVLGSAGSVVPIFREQIEKGEPITVTHPEMTRYFMTIPEASQLVLQAGALAVDGGEIFILDMGRPVKILDLAEDMIRLSGLVPYEDIDIRFTGIRDGEKLFEELEITGENLLKTRHPKIFIGKIAEFSRMQVANIVDEFTAAVAANDGARVRTAFNEFLPEATVRQAVPPTAKDTSEAGELGTKAELKLTEKLT